MKFKLNESNSDYNYFNISGKDWDTWVRSNISTFLDFLQDECNDRMATLAYNNIYCHRLLYLFIYKEDIIKAAMKKIIQKYIEEEDDALEYDEDVFNAVFEQLKKDCLKDCTKFADDLYYKSPIVGKEEFINAIMNLQVDYFNHNAPTDESLEDMIYEYYNPYREYKEAYSRRKMG